MLGSSYLNDWGRIHGISDCVFMESGCKEPEDSEVAETVQAVLGAVHKDRGRAQLYRVMRRLNLSNHVALGMVSVLILPFLTCRLLMRCIERPHEPENPVL